MQFPDTFTNDLTWAFQTSYINQDHIERSYHKNLIQKWQKDQEVTKTTIVILVKDFKLNIEFQCRVLRQADGIMNV